MDSDDRSMSIGVYIVITLTILILTLAIFIGGSEGCSERQRERIEHRREVELRLADNGVDPNIPYRRGTMYVPTDPVVPPGAYYSHIGNPSHGYWGPTGWVFHDPFSEQAIATRNFYIASGLGLAAMRSLSRDSWEKENPTGYNEEASQRRQVTTTKYIGKGGKEISKKEYDRRKIQSAVDKAKFRERLLLKKKQQQKGSVSNNKANKPKQKPQKSLINKGKSEKPFIKGGARKPPPKATGFGNNRGHKKTVTERRHRHKSKSYPAKKK